MCGWFSRNVRDGVLIYCLFLIPNRLIVIGSDQSLSKLCSSSAIDFTIYFSYYATSDAMIKDIQTPKHNVKEK